VCVLQLYFAQRMCCNCTLLSSSWPLHTNHIPWCVCNFAQVSSAELKLRQKVTEQREKEESKARDNRAKEAQKVLTKISGTKLGLEALISKPDFASLPEMVRRQLQQLMERLDGIHESCSNMVETAGSDGGAMLTMMDTIHTTYFHRATSYITLHCFVSSSGVDLRCGLFIERS
jgi:hypothetical protein